MRDLGLEVEELTLDAKVGYSSRIYQLPDEPISWWKFMTVFPETHPKAPESQQYICIVFPIENNCIVAMMGSWGLPAPSDVESFERLARETRSTEFGRVLDASKPLTGVHHTRSTRNVWRRFDRLSAPPPGFIAVGDAVCAFNPIYAQGMSAAAVSGLVVEQLMHCIDPCSAEFPAAFYAEQARVLQRPWSLAVSRDSGYDHAQGTETITGGLRKNVLRRLTWPAFQFLAEAIWQDSVVDAHFNRVLNIQESLADFLTNPRVLAGLGLYGAKKLLRLTGMPPPVPAHRPPPDTDYSALRGLARHEPVSVPESLE
ncbi:hypothetical protein [Nocardia fusca]|uniref:Uncharacterized protein n=1 Tax=Nocardia fusca TaxID=941183 RepID=A0ABV3FGE8_9NOCA